MGIAVGAVCSLSVREGFHLNLLAVTFGYFETLYALRDPMRVQREMNRVESLNTLLVQVGLDPTLYEIFVDATEDAFAQTLAAIQNGEQDETYLVNAFNDEFNSNSIITHFRVCSPEHIQSLR